MVGDRCERVREGKIDSRGREGMNGGGDGGVQGWVGDVARRETRWSREGLWVGEGRKEEERPEWEGR